MPGWTKVQKLAAVAVGAAGGVGIYLSLNRKQTTTVSNAWTTNTIVSPAAKWDYNWDQ